MYNMLYKGKYRKKKGGKLKVGVGAYLIFILISLFVFFFFLFWRAKEKRLLFVSEVKDVFYLVNVDFSRRELVLASMPKNTQVEVSRNLGQWELGSVWKLGEQEKIGGGRLLVDTIRKNFFIPIYLWMPCCEEIFTEMGLFPRLKYFILLPGSNIRISLRLKLFLVSCLGFKETAVIDLAKTKMLEKVVLKTGRSGFLIKDDLPQDLRVFMKEPLFVREGVFVSIINESGSSTIAGQLEKVVSMMGGKIISIKNENNSDIDCLIYSREPSFAKIFSSTFACEISRPTPFSLGGNEVVMRVGKKFLARW